MVEHIAHFKKRLQRFALLIFVGVCLRPVPAVSTAPAASTAPPPLAKRTCPSDGAQAGDPLDPSVSDRMGPYSDLTERPGRFCGLSDAHLLARIKNEPIETIRYNSGGSSISLRLELHHGTWALYKPSQFNENTVPRKEILAYWLNRILGLSRVPPATTRLISTRRYHRTMRDGDVLRRRVVAQSKVSDQTFRGVVSWWIPRVNPLPLERVRWKNRWSRWLDPRKPLPARFRDLAGQISRMVTFDMLLNNQDRFSGANILATPDGLHLYFMDNTLSFFPDTKRRLRAIRHFRRAGRFSRLLYRTTVSLTLSKLQRALAQEKNVSWGFLMTAAEGAGLKQRRRLVLTRIHEQIIRYGWQRVMVFP